MVYFIIGVLVYILLMVFSAKLGEKRIDRAVNKTDFGKVWNFLCDVANACLCVRSSYFVVPKIGSWLDKDIIKND